MSAIAGILAVWLTPVVWFVLPALILAGGTDGLWAGLVLVLSPLVALSVLAPRPAAGGPGGESLFTVVVLLLTVAVLLWANLILAGDVVAWLGAPRWHGVALAAAGALFLTAWPGSERLSVALLLVSGLGFAAPLIVIARDSGIGPLRAWDQVAARPAFRFPPGSPWVTTGRELRLDHGQDGIVFEEEHRLTAAGPGVVRARTRDGAVVSEREWQLEAGQAVTLRAGDQLRATPGLRVRFEADKRVPGAPASGVAWAGEHWDMANGLGFAVTMLGAAMALLPSDVLERPPRWRVTLAGLGLTIPFLWAQGWAVYGALRAPDLFLGGVTLDRLVELPSLALGGSAWGWRLQAMLLVAGLAGFLVSSVALRERLSRLDPTGRGDIGDDLGLWLGVFAVTAMASLWPLDPWSLVRLALGAAASALAPAMLFPPPPHRAGAATVAGAVGLALFLGLSALSQLRGAAPGLVGVVLTYPAVVAMPAGLCVLWAGARR
jgi:hypothetical protein